MPRVKQEPSGGSDCLESLTLVSSCWTTSYPASPYPPLSARSPGRDIFPSLLSPQSGCSQLHNPAKHSPSHAHSLCSFRMVQSPYRMTPEGSTVLDTQNEPQTLPSMVQASTHTSNMLECWNLPGRKQGSSRSCHYFHLPLSPRSGRLRMSGNTRKGCR